MIDMPSTLPGKACWQTALAALNRREHSRAGLASRLRAKGFDDDDVQRTIERLVELQWLSDDRYAGALARTRAASGQGPRRIEVELARQGIPTATAERALATCDVDWPAQARALVVRRFGEQPLRGTPDERKALAFLLRRGFDPGIAQAAVRGDVD